MTSDTSPYLSATNSTHEPSEYIRQRHLAGIRMQTKVWTPKRDVEQQERMATREGRQAGADKALLSTARLEVRIPRGRALLLATCLQRFATACTGSLLLATACYCLLLLLVTVRYRLLQGEDRQIIADADRSGRSSTSGQPQTTPTGPTGSRRCLSRLRGFAACVQDRLVRRHASARDWDRRCNQRTGRRGVERVVCEEAWCCGGKRWEA